MATDWRWPPESAITGVLNPLNSWIETAHHLARGMLHGDVVERVKAGEHLAPEEDVGRRIDVIGKRQVLVDRLDAVAPWRRADC